MGNKDESLDYELLSPYLVLRMLPELASNTLPNCIESGCSGKLLKPWELLEEGVYFFFRTILMLPTIRLGKERLFQNEPEGIVLVNREDNPFALIYECKARKYGYQMTSDEVLRYKNYIKRKREEIRHRHNLLLTHFVIVSSSFSGNIKERTEDIGGCGIVMSMLPATQLTSLYDTLRLYPPQEIRLLEIRRIFCSGVVTQDHLCTWTIID